MLPVVVEDDVDEELPAEHEDDNGLLDSASDASAASDSDIDSLSTAEGSAFLHPDISAADPGPNANVLTAKELRAAAKTAKKAAQEAEAAAKSCAVCGQLADAKWLTCTCSARFHIECLAKRFLQVRRLFSIVCFCTRQKCSSPLGCLLAAYKNNAGME